MNSICEELWYGSVCTSKNSMEGNEEITELLKLIGKNKSNLEDVLTENKKGTLENLILSFEEYADIVGKEAFAKGLSMGIKLAFEAFHN